MMTIVDKAEEIDPCDEEFAPWRQNFMEVTPACRCGNMLEAFNRDNALRDEYVGRELLEMLQNADDQHSSHLEFSLDTHRHTLTIVNSGPKTIPFNKRGFICLIRADTSGKKVLGNSAIGNKGRGFRSLLNWAEDIEIQSNGVKCNFGVEERKKNWEIIKNNPKDKVAFEPLLSNLLAEVGKTNPGMEIPLSILSVPTFDKADVPTGSVEEGYRTQIRVTYSSENEDVEKVIREQLTSLTAEFLLFVRHLESVTINIDDQNRTIKRQEEKRLDGFSALGDYRFWSLMLDDGTGPVKWIKAIRKVSLDEKDNEIGVAWRADCEPLPKEKRVAYTYFPTAFQLLTLPCLLHATFRLDSSRNGIDRAPENKALMGLCGKTLADVAACIATHNNLKDGELSDDQVWFPHDMLDFGEIAGNDELRVALRKGAECGLSENRIYPVTSHAYVTQSEIVCFGAELAKFLLENQIETSFPNHVWPGFEARGVKPQKNVSLHDNADKLAIELIGRLAKEDSVEKTSFKVYVDFVELLCGIRERLDKDLKVSCLPDPSHRVIPKDVRAWVNCGERLEGAADSLGIHYVDECFIERYRDAGYVKGEWDNGRGLVEHLRGLSTCSSSDINPMKDWVVEVSMKGYPDARGVGHEPFECFQAVMKSLYGLYVKKPGEGRMSLYFHVLCEDGNVRVASDACIWDESGQIGVCALINGLALDNKWKMKGSLRFWQEFLESDNADQYSRVVDFLRYYLGVSFGFPCQVRYCTDCGDYLSAQCKIADSYEVVKPHYFKKENFGSLSKESFRTSMQLEANTLFVPDVDFYKTLREKTTPLDLFVTLLGDSGLCDRIAYRPIANYNYHSTKQCTLQQSYLAYIMQKDGVFSELTRLSAESVEAQIAGFDEAGKTRARNIMRILGISTDLEDCSVQQIYEKLAAKQDPKGVQNYYSRARLAIHRCVLKGAATDSICSQLAFTTLKKLYARVTDKTTKKRELVLCDRTKIFYWDNALVSRSLLESLPRLEIGSRVGAVSVEKYFGVRQLKSEDIVILDAVVQAEQKDLSKQVTARVQQLRAYLLSARFQDEWNETIELQAKKLKSFALGVVAPVESAFYLKARNGTDDGTRYSLAEGDLLQDKARGIYWICTAATSFDELWAKRSLRNAVVESLCIQFGLTGTQVESAFHEVLRNTSEENEELRLRIVTDEKWTEILSALGLSSEERAFWKLAAQNFGRQIPDGDLDNLFQEQESWKSVLRSWKNVESLSPEIESIDGGPFKSAKDIAAIAHFCAIPPAELPLGLGEIVRRWLEQKIEGLQLELEPTFAQALHQSLRQKDVTAEKKIQYIPLLRHFMDEFQIAVLKSIDFSKPFPGDMGECAQAAAVRWVKSEFGLELTGDVLNQAPVPLPEYAEILDKETLTCLPLEKQSLAYFEGNAEELGNAFKKWHEDHADAVAKLATQKDEAVDEYVLKPSDLIKSDQLHRSSHSLSGRKGGVTAFPTEEENLARGESAEDTVKRMLEKWKAAGECKCFGARSSISNATGTASDSAHFDFWYKTPNDEIRLIEVKSYSGTRVIMSAGEYEKACSPEWRDRYDLVLVMNGKPYVLQAPFGSQTNFKESYLLEPASYNLKISLNSAVKQGQEA